MKAAVVWIQYDEDPDFWHAHSSVTGKLLCGRDYFNGVAGPYLQMPSFAPGFEGLCTECKEKAAAAEVRPKRHRELEDSELDRLSPDEIKEAYKALRSHHIEETTHLIEKLRRLDNR